MHLYLTTKYFQILKHRYFKKRDCYNSFPRKGFYTVFLIIISNFVVTCRFLYYFLIFLLKEPLRSSLISETKQGGAQQKQHQNFCTLRTYVFRGSLIHWRHIMKVAPCTVVVIKLQVLAQTEKSGDLQKCKWAGRSKYRGTKTEKKKALSQAREPTLIHKFVTSTPCRHNPSWIYKG